MTGHFTNVVILYRTLLAISNYPWIKIHDPLKVEGKSTRHIPPSGHIVGVYARTDIERGVHKAPANEVIRGVIDL